MTPRMRRSQGFTLLEMLAVLAVLGVVSGMFAFLLTNSVRRSEVRQAAIQLATELRQARTAAQKTGAPRSVTVLSGTTGYTAQSLSGTVISRTLDKGIRVFASSSEQTVTYRPPYGTLESIGAVWEVRSPSSQVDPLFVKVVGITGKVMISANED